MLPWIEPPVLVVGSVTLHAFWLTTLSAVVTGYGMCVWRAGRLGLPRATIATVTAWVIVTGLVSAHVFDVLAYNPHRLLEDPAILLRLDAGLSSFGGMMGGVAAGVFLLWRREASRRDALLYVDAIAWAFPFAWLFGRLGCSLTHDHLGRFSNSALAVRFPEGARFDLGLLELFWTVPVAIAFFMLRNQTHPPGRFLGVFFTLYGPMRMVLDGLRSDDATYFGLTPGQYLGAASLALGITVLRRTRGLDLVEPRPRPISS